MRIAVAGLNLLLGSVYTSYGLMSLVEMKRGWRTMGFSHFGAAWVAMAFTCGPHHLAHGIHLGFEGRAPGGLDLAAVLVGLPAGVAWFLLRVEAFRGGRGDRFVSGTPAWVAAVPVAGVMYFLALGFAAGLILMRADVRLTSMAVPNLLLLGIYCTIGYVLFRTQFRSRERLRGWSVSGCSLGIVFPTCGLMHTVWATYGLTGLYEFDIHGFVIDWAAVPAALYFLWVVRGLYRDALRDWNRVQARPVVLVG